MGNGPNGPVTVGVEVKAVTDALACMTDGRFAGHQLPGLVRTYERVWLVLEGVVEVQLSSGILMVRRRKSREAGAVGQRRFMYRDLSNWLTTMEMCGGVHIRSAATRVETARFLADLFSWWSKDWHDHKSHLAFDKSGPDTALLRPPGLTRRVAAELPGIGWGKSAAVAARFGTVEELALATEDEWREIDGIGDVLAERIYGAIRSR